MGLLEALDYYNALSLSDDSVEHIKVEYRLLSWGEIFPPFMGDREHSIAARHILTEYPFKLFSTSKPYDDPLPQKLTLTFLAPNVVINNSVGLHSSGYFPHKTAEEFAAFLSVVTRRRIFVSHQTRYDELPMEQEAYIYKKLSSQEKQMLKEIDPKEIYKLLHNLSKLERNIAQAFILALRLYHTAIQMMFTEPEFSYLLLITCIEAISSVVYKDYIPNDVDAYLSSRFPRLLKVLNVLDDKSHAEAKKILFKNEHFITRKFSKFIIDFLPERFWDETLDDAKPDYLQRVIYPGEDGKGELQISSSDKTLQPYEMIDRGNLGKTLRKIYSARSELVHSGVRFPASIVIGHFRSVSSEASSKIMHEFFSNPIKESAEKYLQIPPLQTFERMTSYTLANYLKATTFE